MSNWNDDFDKRWAKSEKAMDSIFGFARWIFVLVFTIIILSILAQIALAFGLLHVVTTTEPSEIGGLVGEIVKGYEDAKKGE